MNHDEMLHDRCHMSFLPFSVTKLHASGTVGIPYTVSLKKGWNRGLSPNSGSEPNSGTASLDTSANPFEPVSSGSFLKER